MARGDSKLTCCELVQLTDSNYWNWTTTEKVAIDNVDLKEIGRILTYRLNAIKCVISSMYIINHTNDTRLVWDESYGDYVSEKKPNHIHCLIKFSVGEILPSIASAVGLEPQYVNKAKKGKFSYDNMVAYLIHAKDISKFQYSPKDVITIVGDDYLKIYSENKINWEKGRATKNVIEANKDINWLIDQIYEGKISKKRAYTDSRFKRIYFENIRRCDEAFRFVGNAKSYATLNALQRGDFKLSVFYIKGITGSGKTWFAKSYIEKQIQARYESTGERWEEYKAATKNSLDDYAGEEIIFLDDSRGNSMSASEWLLLLDPYNISPASARFKNKTLVASRVIVITSTFEPLIFFNQSKERNDTSDKEIMDQFIRRLTCSTSVYREGIIGSNNQPIGISSTEFFSPPINVALSEFPNDVVPMSYWFENEIRYTREEAINVMIDYVAKNHMPNANAQGPSFDIVSSDSTSLNVPSVEVSNGSY